MHGIEAIQPLTYEQNSGERIAVRSRQFFQEYPEENSIYKTLRVQTNAVSTKIIEQGLNVSSNCKVTEKYL